MKALLALDTSSETPSLALDSCGKVHTWTAQAPLTLSEHLLPAIDHLLRQAGGLKPEDLEGVVACTGPGIFTGIRVGLATLKGILAPFSGLRVWQTNALAAWALQTDPQTRGTIRIILDARRNQIYTASYQWQDGLLLERDAPCLCPSEPLPFPAPTLLLGRMPEPPPGWPDGYPSPADNASSILAPHMLQVPERTVIPSGTTRDLLPLYLRAPDARPPAPPAP